VEELHNWFLLLEILVEDHRGALSGQGKAETWRPGHSMRILMKL
jgi:hypothetical protein